MGISMSLYLCDDAQIREFSDDVNRVEDFIIRSPNRGDCYLADFWDGIHYLLTSGTDTRDLPLAALKTGDVEFRGGASATHAIFSETAKAFAEELQSLSEQTLRERFDPGRMLEARVDPIRPWLFPEHAESTFRDLMFYFDRLRNIASAASREGQGLLFTRYEDW
ncbi:MAG TPA: DUF1877 family protein [Blastocatellia bacterium]|jgi:hypothetical protein|nr:DUF1877 family protein [Blastocatellia bacterium]